MAESELEAIHAKLGVAARILDAAASDIAQAGLEERKKLIGNIGEILALVFEIQRCIEQKCSALMSSEVADSPELSAANGRLTSVLADAIEMAESGQVDHTADLLQRYLGEESSPLHREIASGELQRILRDRT